MEVLAIDVDGVPDGDARSGPGLQELPIGFVAGFDTSVEADRVPEEPPRVRPELQLAGRPVARTIVFPAVSCDETSLIEPEDALQGNHLDEPRAVEVRVELSCEHVGFFSLEVADLAAVALEELVTGSASDVQTIEPPAIDAEVSVLVRRAEVEPLAVEPELRGLRLCPLVRLVLGREAPHVTPFPEDVRDELLVLPGAVGVVLPVPETSPELDAAAVVHRGLLAPEAAVEEREELSFARRRFHGACPALRFLVRGRGAVGVDELVVGERRRPHSPRRNERQSEECCQELVGLLHDTSVGSRPLVGIFSVTAAKAAVTTIIYYSLRVTNY